MSLNRSRTRTYKARPSPPVKVMENKTPDRHGEPARSLLQRVAATALGRVLGDFIIKLIETLDP